MMSPRLSCVALVLGIVFASAAADAAAPSVAVVIGNSTYAAQPALPACQMSARLVAAALTRAGFQVTELNNPSNARTGTAIAALGDDVAATPGSRSVIYICGYVAPFAERLFVLPTEARLERPTDVLTQGIVARLLMSSVAAPGAAAGLVLMDVVPQPGTDPQIAFSSMLRPTDNPNAGLAAALLPTTRAIGASPLAAAFSDMVRGGNLDLARALADLPTTLAAARAQMLISRPPQVPSWLIGGPVDAPPPQAAVSATAAAAAPPVAGSQPGAPIAAEINPAELNPAERRRIQLGLQRLGYFHGRISGVFAGDTLAAIRRFQQESKEAVTGKLTAEQASQLLGS
jgi:hypothetical protein